MDWLLKFADLIAGLLGVAGSVVLGLPLIRDASDRRKWETLLRLKSRTDSNDPGGYDYDHWKKLRDDFIDERLGGYLSYRQAMAWGMMLLLLAFIFMLVATLVRHAEPLGPTNNAQLRQSDLQDQ